ncbi:hypothetical protein ACOMHN_027397 [Nucella lapillus]
MGIPDLTIAYIVSAPHQTPGYLPFLFRPVIKVSDQTVADPISALLIWGLTDRDLHDWVAGSVQPGMSMVFVVFCETRGQHIPSEMDMDDLHRKTIADIVSAPHQTPGYLPFLVRPVIKVSDQTVADPISALLIWGLTDRDLHDWVADSVQPGMSMVFIVFCETRSVERYDLFFFFSSQIEDF